MQKYTFAEWLRGEVAAARYSLITLHEKKDKLLSFLWDEYELSVSDAESLGLKFENKDEAKAQITSLKNSIPKRTETSDEKSLFRM